MQIIIYTILVLGITGFVGALALHITAKRFAVEEDPRIAEIESKLAGANCGGCGFSGCHAFATECVRRGTIEGMRCPVSSPAVMDDIAKIMGCTPVGETVRKVAVLKCNGTCAARPTAHSYDGPASCAIIDSVGAGTTACAYGCLGCGDCVRVCLFGALSIDTETGLPVVDTDKCTSCGKCVSECPRHILELIPEGRRGRRVWVACSNRERGATARKGCASACIGCGKCTKTCSFEAATVTDFLSHIDPDKCKACGKCAAACPTGAILTSFVLPQRKNDDEQ